MRVCKLLRKASLEGASYIGFRVFRVLGFRGHGFEARGFRV